MLKRALVIVTVLTAALYAVLYIAGSGMLSDGPDAGTIEARAIDPAVIAERARADPERGRGRSASHGRSRSCSVTFTSTPPFRSTRSS